MELIISRHDIDGATTTAFLFANGVDRRGAKFCAHTCYTPGRMKKQGIPKLAAAVDEKRPALFRGPRFWRLWRLRRAIRDAMD